MPNKVDTGRVGVLIIVFLFFLSNESPLPCAQQSQDFSLHLIDPISFPLLKKTPSVHIIMRLYLESTMLNNW